MILQPSGTSQARYSETDFSELTDNPLRIRCGIYMVVVSGTATLETATDTYRLVPQMELSFISGGIIHCHDRSGDFRVRVFTYTSELLTQIALPIDHIYFDYNEAHPTYIHTPDSRSQRTWRELLLWMDMASMLFARKLTSDSGKCRRRLFYRASGCGTSARYRNVSRLARGSPTPS